jgi:hypothetical protein
LMQLHTSAASLFTNICPVVGPNPAKTGKRASKETAAI